MDYVIYGIATGVIIVLGLFLITIVGLLSKLHESVSRSISDINKCVVGQTSLSIISSQLIDVIGELAEEIDSKSIRFISGTTGKPSISAGNTQEAIDKLNKIGYTLTEEDINSLKKIFESPDELTDGDDSPFEDGE